MTDIMTKLTAGRELDIATVLPPAPAAKLRALRAERDAALDLAAGIRERVARAREALTDAKRQAALIFGFDPHARFGEVPPNVVVTLPRVDRSAAEAAAEQRVAERHDELAQVEARLEAAVQQSAALKTLIERIESYLSDARAGGARLDAHDGAIDVPGRADAAAVAALRAELAELEAERRRIDAAPRPLAEIEAAIVAEVNRLAATSEPSVEQLARRDVKGTPQIKFPETYDPASRSRQRDVIGFLCWLARDAVIERLAEVATQRFGAGGLSDAERSARLAEIDDRRLALQRLEEATIVRAAAAGVTVLRRAEADPRAVVGLSAAAPSPKGDRP